MNSGGGETGPDLARVPAVEKPTFERAAARPYRRAVGRTGRIDAGCHQTPAIGRCTGAGQDTEAYGLEQIEAWEAARSEYMHRLRRLEDLQAQGRYGYQLRLPRAALGRAIERLRALGPEFCRRLHI